MRIKKHGKYYYNTANVSCEECGCIYEIGKEDIKKYPKPVKITVGWIECTWKVKRNYYTLCPECGYENTMSDEKQYEITKQVIESKE